ncbi:MAG: cytochrome d ubiquinol oxidase subunit II [Fibromonadaceae bacterium]|jgi:cytochrome d ubiquinol oxidase subunit II|nr:cytochrome d ubiquinol oxidase subunit II [Fibromonadaceae bacterium]
MNLEIIWFTIIAALLAGFIFLEGFDFGVGILQFFLGKHESERRTYIYSISSHWDANEVWLLAAVGATFAVFPIWYATLFSALYLPLTLLLLALIVRGVCFEFRHRASTKTVRTVYDVALMASSSLAAFIIGVVMANLAAGIPINKNGIFTGSVLDLASPVALLAGALCLSLFLSNGALFLTLKIEGELQERACKFSRLLILISLLLFLLMTLVVLIYCPFCLIALLFISASAFFVFRRSFNYAFISLGLCSVCSVAILFYAMFPNVLISTVAENSLTVWNTASPEYTLRIMSMAAAISAPVILACQIWSYYVFRKRINPINAR